GEAVENTTKKQNNKEITAAELRPSSSTHFQTPHNHNSIPTFNHHNHNQNRNKKENQRKRIEQNKDRRRKKRFSPPSSPTGASPRAAPPLPINHHREQFLPLPITTAASDLSLAKIRRELPRFLPLG
ncbi:hypothetical protein A2U01_0040073, partial [Trifolium medium]|nr:hypothetical protein [Trifolium medium]